MPPVPSQNKSTIRGFNRATNRSRLVADCGHKWPEAARSWVHGQVREQPARSCPGTPSESRTAREDTPQIAFEWRGKPTAHSRIPAHDDRSRTSVLASGSWSKERPRAPSHGPLLWAPRALCDNRPTVQARAIIGRCREQGVTFADVRVDWPGTGPDGETRIGSNRTPPVESKRHKPFASSLQAE